MGAEVLGAQVPPRGVVQPQRAPQGQHRHPQKSRASLADGGCGTLAARRPREAGPALREELWPGSPTQPLHQGATAWPQRPRYPRRPRRLGHVRSIGSAGGRVKPRRPRFLRSLKGRDAVPCGLPGVTTVTPSGDQRLCRDWACAPVRAAEAHPGVFGNGFRGCICSRSAVSGDMWLVVSTSCTHSENIKPPVRKRAKIPVNARCGRGPTAAPQPLQWGWTRHIRFFCPPAPLLRFYCDLNHKLPKLNGGLGNHVSLM
jgi:hypothetical protein